MGWPKIARLVPYIWTKVDSVCKSHDVRVWAVPSFHWKVMRQYKQKNQLAFQCKKYRSVYWMSIKPALLRALNRFHGRIVQDKHWIWHAGSYLKFSDAQRRCFCSQSGQNLVQKVTVFRPDLCRLSYETICLKKWVRFFLFSKPQCNSFFTRVLCHFRHFSLRLTDCYKITVKMIN